MSYPADRHPPYSPSQRLTDLWQGARARKLLIVRPSVRVRARRPFDTMRASGVSEIDPRKTHMFSAGFVKNP